MSLCAGRGRLEEHTEKVADYRSETFAELDCVCYIS